MITVEQAIKIIEDNTLDLGNETIPLEKSINRILKEDWHTDRDLPPYDRITMDGIAIKFEDFKNGLRVYPIEDVAGAGMSRKTIKTPGNCMEVMTGSILPNGTDTVIRYEDLIIENQIATVQKDDIKYSQNVHFKGEDRKKDDLIVKSNTLISPAEIGVGASIGKSDALVARLPKVMVISTGDELVPINAQPLEHQIRRSNAYRLVSTLKSKGITADNIHFNDHEEDLTQGLQSLLETYDAIIISGGVSKGKFDFLPKVLEKLNVQKLFHIVKQRPGKPFWFGTYRNKCTVFALPGNPVSSFMCMQKYFFHWLHATLFSRAPALPYGILQKDVIFTPDLTYFLEVKLSINENANILATPVKGNGSGDLANMADADAFIELKRGKEVYHKGEIYPLIIYRNIFNQ